MGKDVFIDVPCAHYELRAHPPEVKDGKQGLFEKATIHLVVVPEEALAEVQEVLKKYQPQVLRFNELLNKVIKAKEG